MGFGLIVEFAIRAEQRGAFQRLVEANAAASLRDEAGCEVFDVLTPDDAPNSVVLYEIYKDANAFQAHLDSAHYAAFAAATDALVEKKTVRKLRLHRPAS